MAKVSQEIIDRVLAGISSTLRLAILDDFRIDSCIASTSAVIKVLAHYQILARPYPVKAFVWNPAYVREVTAKNFPPEDTAEFRAWCDMNGAWSVGLGFAPSDPKAPVGWEGHLVAAIPTANILIDASIDQASRPQHDIHLERGDPVIAPVSREWIEREHKGAEFHSDFGLVLHYEHDTKNLRYERSKDWLDYRRVQRAVRRTIAAIDAL